MNDLTQTVERVFYIAVLVAVLPVIVKLALVSKRVQFVIRFCRCRAFKWRHQENEGHSWTKKPVAEAPGQTVYTVKGEPHQVSGWKRYHCRNCGLRRVDFILPGGTQPYEVQYVTPMQVEEDELE